MTHFRAYNNNYNAMEHQLEEEKQWSVDRNCVINNADPNLYYKEFRELQHGDGPNWDGNKDFIKSVFDIALYRGDVHMLKLLLTIDDFSIDNQIKRFWPESPLAHAILNKNHQVIQLLVNHGFNPDLKLTSQSIYGQEKRPATMPFNYWYKTIQQNDVSTFQCLLECVGREVNNKKWSQKLLLTACGLGSTAIAEYLLNKGVSIESIDKDGWTCILYAVAYRHKSVIQLLVDRGANIKVKDSRGRSILQIAVFYHHIVSASPETPVQIFRFLVNNGAEINTTDINDYSTRQMLFEACYLGSSMIIEYLLDHGVSIECTDKDGWTCIFYAIAYNRISIVRLLMARGANIKHKDSKNRSVLHIAVLRVAKFLHSVKLVRLLIENGAEINATDITGSTPINAVCGKIDSMPIVEELLRHPDIDLAKPNVNGTTFLHRVLSANVYDYNFIEKMLIEALSRPYVDINAQDKNGKTPLEFIDLKKCDILCLMLEFGADVKVLTKLMIEKRMFENPDFMQTLGRYGLKRSVAGLSDDLNIETLLDQYDVFRKKEYNKLVSMYFQEVQLMKKTQLYEKLTFFDFLHAKKKLTCIKVVKISGVCETFIKRRRNFKHYAKMLDTNFIRGSRSLTPIEIQAINSVEDNLDVIFNNRLPSLVLYLIKEYLDIDDMITLKNVQVS